MTRTFYSFKRTKKTSYIKYAFRKCRTRARELSPTLVHANTKNEKKTKKHTNTKEKADESDMEESEVDIGNVTNDIFCMQI